MPGRDFYEERTHIYRRKIAPVTRSPGYWYGLWRARKLLFQILPSNQNVADGLERWGWKVGRQRLKEQMSLSRSDDERIFTKPVTRVCLISCPSLAYFIQLQLFPFFSIVNIRGTKWNFLCIGKPKSFSSWEMERSVTSRSEIKCPTQ